MSTSYDLLFVEGWFSRDNPTNLIFVTVSKKYVEVVLALTVASLTCESSSPATLFILVNVFVAGRYEIFLAF
jgi:hypothetical protein